MKPAVPRPLLLLLAALAILAGCDTSSPPSPTPDGPAVTGTPDRQPDAPATAPPPLTGFFEPGNFAMMTIPTATGGDERLSIRELSVKVSVVGRLARTEVTQVFHNHTNAQTEGTYEFTLPAGAAVSRLAMTVDGQLMEGELVEREKARQIYEQIVRQKKDPALLEWQGGERFRTQIFPIPANGDKTVVLGYEQVLPREGREVRYRYALPHLEGEPAGSLIGHFMFTVNTAGTGALTATGYDLTIDGAKATFDGQQFVPKGPLGLTFTDTTAAGSTVRYAERKGERFFLLDYLPELPPQSQGGRQDVVLALDTSAGIGATELARVVATVKALVAALPEGVRFNVVHGDLRAEACAAAPIQAPAAAPSCLDALDAGGATDLGALLGAAIDAARPMAGSPTAIVVFTDGVASYGQLDGDLLRSTTVKALGEVGASLHTVAIGHEPDEGFLATLAAEGRGHSVRMTPQDTPTSIVETVGHVVHEPLLSDITVEAIGGKVEGLVPHHGVHLARGESLAVMGRLDEGKTSVRVRGMYNGQPIERTFDLDGSAASPDNDLVVNFWARAVIEEIERGHANRDKIVQTSLHYGVMSRYTSFLVLENDQAYKQFQVARLKEAERQRKVEEDQKQQQQQNLTKGTGNLQEVLAANKDKAPGGEAPAPEPSPGDDAKEEEGKVGDENAPAERADRQIVAKNDVAELADPKPLEREIEESEESDDVAAARPPLADPQRRREPPAPPRRAGERLSGLGQIDTGGGKGSGLGNLDGKDSGLRKDKRKKSDGNYYDNQLAQLEGRRDSLSVAEQARLIEVYVNVRQKAKAKAYLQELTRAVPADQRPDGVYALFEPRPALREAFPKEYEAVAREMLARQPTPANVVNDLWDYLAQARRFGELEKTFANTHVDPLTASTNLWELISTWNQPAVAERLLDQWTKAGLYTQGELYQIVTANPNLKARLGRQLYTISAELVRTGDSRPEVMDDFVRTATEQGKAAEAADTVLARCAQPKETEVEFCYQWYTATSADPRVKARLVELNKDRLVAVAKQRQQDMGNIQLILHQVQLLREVGEATEAMRRLSEMVEFAPHDYATRVAYAQQLTQAKLVDDACAQYAAAVQLNPSERDAFRTMMALRRDFESHATGLRRCIVDGVSNLPVQRAVSLVLTWEDPSADVDLHVHEVGGEEVFFSHRESANAGLLYYDITDGFGPEIYVLGSGPAGEYRLTLVYYSGTARNITGTLTILRNAGSPEETREDRAFTLPVANSSLQLPMGVFRL